MTLVDSNLPSTGDRARIDEVSYSLSSHTASIDSSRIIRPDYANPVYAKLAAEAQEAWRRGFGGEDVYHESGLVVAAGTEGCRYVEAACRNVENVSGGRGKEGDLAKERRKERKDVERLDSPEEIRAAVGLPALDNLSAASSKNSEQSGSTGYMNHTSGWANAEGAMRTNIQRILSYTSTSLLTLKRAQVKQLLFSPCLPKKGAKTKPTVTGVILTDSSQLEASLTILATGAWTPSLLDLQGRVQATGQVVAYLPLTALEAETLQHMPILLNLSTGYFVIPPALNSSSSATSSRSSPQNPPSKSEAEGASEDNYTHHIKIARHAYGYVNPTPIVLLPPPGTSQPIHISPSLPSPSFFSTIPPSALTGLRSFQQTLFPPPHPLSHRPFSHTRLCWYTDTPTGDFLITYHPEYDGLFLCTGGSGHGFKFLPVLGARVVDVLRGEAGEWAEVWRWRDVQEEWKGDGSRGGTGTEVLARAMEDGEGGGRERGRSKL